MIENAVLIAVVTGLTELVKRMGWIKTKYLPLFSLVLGLVAGYIYTDGIAIAEKVIYGLMIGLSASGLFDQTKILTKKPQNQDNENHLPS